MSLLDSRRSLLELQPKRVCIIKPSALGDVVNAFAALAVLRKLWPAAQFTWVINQSLRGLVEGHPLIDDVVIFDRKRASFKPKGISSFFAFLRELRRGNFDLAVDLQGLLRSGLMTAATSAPVRVGLADAREGATLFYTHRVRPADSEVHAVDRLLAVARSFGGDVANPQFEVAITDADRAWAAGELSKLTGPVLALNLGARWETKRWPPESFAEVARRAVEARGVGLLAIGAPEDRPFVDDLIARLQPIPVVNVCGQTTLPQLAALAEASALVLSNDTGPLHLAVGAGARVVGVYTCTSPALNGPYGPRALAVQTDVWCKGSYITKCARLECMSELTPDRVWPLVLKQLDAALAENRAK